MTTDEATRALQRFIEAQSPAEMAQVFANEPALRGPEVAELLQQKEQEARQQGLHDIAADFARLRQVLSKAGEQVDAPVPAAPGCDIAAEVIIALMDVAPDVPVPAAALSGPFFLVTGGAWRVHFKQHNAHRLAQLEQLDARADAVARAMDKKQRRRVRDVLANLERWLAAKSWQASSEFLDAHKDILSPDTAEILELLEKGAHAAGAKDDEKLYRQHLDILAHAPAGLESIFEQLIAEEEHEEMQQRFRDETLSAWLEPEQQESIFPIRLGAEKPLSEARLILDAIETALKTPPEQRINYRDVHRATSIRFVHPRMPPEDLRRAEDLYMNAVQRGGTGINDIEQGLLDNIAVGADTGSMPFWMRVLDIRKPRDNFSKKRRTLALAALAALAIRNDSAEAVQAFRDLLQHTKDDIRSNAVYYLGQVYLFTEKAPPPDVQAEIETVSTSAPDFPSRFHARNVLRYCLLPIPIDNPGGVYSFLVRYLGSGYERVAGITRTIEMTAEQTLEDLHEAILTSVSFDADHLYAFYMTGDERDERFEIDAPQGSDGFGFGYVDAMWGGGGAGALNSYEATIGQLGLVRGHRFLYEFDFGDQHMFAVQVIGLLPQSSSRTEYPRIVARTGKSPEQYPSQDDLDGDDDDGEDDEEDEEEE